MRRQAFDFYATPGWATTALAKQLAIAPGADVLEPCAGDLDIANALRAGGVGVRCNDIRAGHEWCGDATDPHHWRAVGEPDWSISNPPFSLAAPIVKNAIQFSRVGVAMLLRLSFLEPCAGRVDLMSKTPPDQLIVTPRISFTGDGKRDTSTTAWFIWSRAPIVGPPLIILAPDRPEPGGLI